MSVESRRAITDVCCVEIRRQQRAQQGRSSAESDVCKRPAYVDKTLDVQLADGRTVAAVVYVIDADHDQYCGGMPLEEQAQIITTAVGGMGPNTEYLFNTASHLSQIGLHDPSLEWLHARVKQLCA